MRRPQRGKVDVAASPSRSPSAAAAAAGGGRGVAPKAEPSCELRKTLMSPAPPRPLAPRRLAPRPLVESGPCERPPKCVAPEAAPKGDGDEEEDEEDEDEEEDEEDEGAAGGPTPERANDQWAILRLKGNCLEDPTYVLSNLTTPVFASGVSRGDSLKTRPATTPRPAEYAGQWKFGTL